MPVVSKAQGRLMRAIAHGWRPSRMKRPPSKKVAREYIKHKPRGRLPERKRRRTIMHGG